MRQTEGLGQLLLVVIGMVVGMFLLSCSKNSAESTATAFVDLYYVRIDQQKALQLTTGLAAQKIRKELDSLRGINPEQRIQGKHDLSIDYTLDETREEEGKRYFLFNLKVDIPQSKPIEKKVMITTTLLDGKWQVTNYDEFDLAR